MQERQDGTNVNQWHWTERDCFEWSKQRLTALFTDKVLVSGADGLAARCTGIEAISGEAFLNVRKAKLIPSYELELKVKWTGQVKEGDGTTECSGKIHFPYIAGEARSARHRSLRGPSHAMHCTAHSSTARSSTALHCTQQHACNTGVRWHRCEVAPVRPRQV